MRETLKKIALLVFFSLLSYIFIEYTLVIQNTLRAILEWEKLNYLVWCFVIISFILHALTVDDQQNYQSGIIYKKFGRFGGYAFDIVTYGVAMSTSLAILKGVYIQLNFGDIIYFNHFEQIDIYSLFIVCIFLFGYSINECIQILLETFRTSTSKKAEASN